MIFDDLKVTNHAKTAQNEVVAYLKSKGFECATEVVVSSRGDGTQRTGRIDIVAKKDGKILAIEFDQNSPRKKSLMKLNNYECDYRLVLLRGGDKKYKEGNIVVLSIPIK